MTLLHPCHEDNSTVIAAIMRLSRSQARGRHDTGLFALVALRVDLEHDLEASVDLVPPCARSAQVVEPE